MLPVTWYGPAGAGFTEIGIHRNGRNRADGLGRLRVDLMQTVFRLSAMAAVLAACFWPAVASAQSAAATASDQAADQLERTLKSATVEDALGLAEIAIAEGRFEQAVGILSGLLLRDPQNPSLLLLLGDLYSRLGSFAQAKLYVDQAVATGQLNAAQKQEADLLIALVTTGQPAARDPFSFAGRLSTGLRYRTNATGGTKNDTVLINDQAVAAQNNAGEVEDYDWSATLTARAGYVVQPGIELDANGLVFIRKQFEQSQNDLLIVELEPGVSFELANSKEFGMVVRPFGVVGVGELDNQLAQRILGGGLESRQQVGGRYLFNQSAEFRDVDYEPIDGLAGLNNLDGSEARFELGGIYLVSDSISAGLNYRATLRDTNQKFDDRTQHRLRGSVTLRYLDPIELTGDKSRFRVAVSYTDTEFDAANRAISAVTVREDEEWSFDISNTLPIAEDLTFDLSGSYTDRDSSLPNFELEDTTVSAGISWRF